MEPKTSKYFAFLVAKPTDRPIFIILCIQTFTVCTMVPLMSLLGTIESSGITSNLIFIWLQTICLNFIMAYPLQILVVGPFCRFIFRHLFASANRGNESKVLFSYLESPLYINQFLLDDLSCPVADIITMAYPFHRILML